MAEHADRYFDKRIETLPPELLRKLQDHRLRWQFRRCWDGSAWYRARFEAAGLNPETFGGLAELTRLPLLTNVELTTLETSTWRVAPSAWIISTTQSASGIVRHQSHGDDVHSWDRSARWRWSAGVVRPAREQLSAELRQSQSAYARLGIAPPASRDSGAVATPSDRTAVALPVRWLDVPLVGDQAGYECPERSGFHWADDQFLAEVIDSVSEQPLLEAVPGELAVTDLVREASPLIRFRTGLTVSMTYKPCVCGRSSSRVYLTGIQA